MNVRYATLTEFTKERKVLSYGFSESSFGLSLLISYGEELTGYGFANHGEEEELLADYQTRWKGQGITFRENKEKAQRLCTEVFSTKPPKLLLLGTSFQQQVWQALLLIPKGQSLSYGELAQEIGRGSAARAVGTAIGKNPISFLVPCHRVCRADGTLGGYHWGVERKKQILAWEKKAWRCSDLG